MVALRSASSIFQVLPTGVYTGPATTLDPTIAAASIQVRMYSWLGAMVVGSVRSRPGPIAAQTDAPRLLVARISATRAGSQSPGFSTPSSSRSKPIALTPGASSAIDSSVGGETQTQALTPIGFMQWLSDSV